VFVVLPDTHALCAKDAIAWEDLQDETFILSRLGRGFAIHDYVIQRLTALEHRPNVRQSPVARDTLIHMVALGQGISLTSEVTIATTFPHVAFRPIAGNSDVLLFSGSGCCATATRLCAGSSVSPARSRRPGMRPTNPPWTAPREMKGPR